MEKPSKGKKFVYAYHLTITKEKKKKRTSIVLYHGLPLTSSVINE